ncbi:MAG: hypothetical protein ACKVP3_25455 [Hyphomicrobiaceae bacterium]
MSSQTLSLRNVLLIDAATCALMGALLTFGVRLLSNLTAISPALLFYAGVVLFPVAAFMVVTAARTALSPFAARIIIAGNALWVVASIGLIVGPWIAPNAWGYTFIAAQAVAVAVLTKLEYDAMRSVEIAA